MFLIALDLWAQGEPARTADQQLPSLAVTDVDIAAESLESAWQAFSQATFVHTVLFLRDGAATSGAFTFKAAQTSVGAILDALVSRYAGIKWQQDPKTGVIWIFPADMQLSDVMSDGVTLTASHYGLPMLSGLLLPLGESNRLGIGLARLTLPTRNTFEYAVDVPAGAYRLRELIDLACAANPTKSFYIVATDSLAIVTPYNMVSEETHALLPGLQSVWARTGAPESLTAANTRTLLSKYLSSDDWQARRAARWALEALIWQIPFDDWLAATDDSNVAIWIALALADVLARDPNATELAALSILRSAASSERIRTGPAPQALYVALELVRLAGDDEALRVFSARQLSTAERSAIQAQWSMVASLVARSPKLREMLVHDSRLASVRGLAPPGVATNFEPLQVNANLSRKEAQ